MAEHRWIVLRGGGDLATGVAQKLIRTGLPLLILETERPTAIRRSVSLCEAVYEGTWKVEDMCCRRVSALSDIDLCLEQGWTPLLVDPAGKSIHQVRPIAVVDAILAKQNLGTYREMAPITIALGPGFIAGKDVDIVVETMRGHDLGRLIFSGSAMSDTGIPGEICGIGAERVLYAPTAGEVRHVHAIGDWVAKGAAVFSVGDIAVAAPFDGVLRGLIREGLCVKEGMKVGDIDPRVDVDWQTISDKARCIGGGVLEAYWMLYRQKNMEAMG